MPTPKVNSWLGWRNFTVNIDQHDRWRPEIQLKLEEVPQGQPWGPTHPHQSIATPVLVRTAHHLLQSWPLGPYRRSRVVPTGCRAHCWGRPAPSNPHQWRKWAQRHLRRHLKEDGLRLQEADGVRQSLLRHHARQGGLPLGSGLPPSDVRHASAQSTSASRSPTPSLPITPS
jgi:hypothetical protein